MKENFTKKGVEKVMKYSPDILCVLSENGEMIEISEACESILGYCSHELTGKTFQDLVYPEDRLKTAQKFQLLEGGGCVRFQSRHLHKTGEMVCLAWSAAWSEEEEAFICCGRPQSVTEPALEGLQKSEELHKGLVQQGSDMIALLDEEGKYLYVGGSTTRALGYEPEQLIGKSAYDFIHPDDLLKVQEARIRLDAVESLQLSEFRFRTAGGEWRWLESYLSNQLLNPHIGALVVSSRDISENKANRRQLEESEQRFKSLFEFNPKMVLLEDEDGIILDVNSAVESTFGIPKEMLKGKPLADFLPQAVIPICKSSLEEVMRGSTMRFNIEVVFETLGRRILDVTKVPVMVNGAINGVYTIANDITAISQSNKIIQDQAKRLSTIFESITDAFFTLDTNWTFTYINKEFDRILQTNRDELIGKQIWSVFPEEENGVFGREYRKAMESGVSGHFEAILPRQQVWLEIKVYPSAEGLAVYFTDISRRVNAQEELLKLSVVAEKSHSGIIITNSDGQVDWVNESVRQITGIPSDEILGRQFVGLLKIQGNYGSDIREAVARLIAGEPFEGEVPFENRSGKALWLKVGATPVLTADGKPFRYIFMFTDISLQKQAIQERNRFIKELQSRNQSLNQFSHVVSHQLRSPVANILGLTSLFKLAETDEVTRAEVVERLMTAANNLDFIIRDLNRVLSLQEPFGIENERLLLDEVITELLQPLQEQLQEKQVEICINFAEAPEVYAVRLYLLDILFHLISNAIKFRAANRKARIEVSSRVEEDCTVVIVKDNGIGFDLEKHKKNIFGLYKRFHLNKGGRGLGLYLVKTQVEALGGKVEVYSKAGEGSVFKVFLKRSNSVKQ